MLDKIRKSFLYSLQIIKIVIIRLKKYKYMVKRVPWTIGYHDYKYDYIGELINSDWLSYFATGKLPSGYGYRLDERVVEYPWFFARLKDAEQTILDAGSVLNHRQILSAEKLKGRDLYISTLYYEGRPEFLPSPSYIYEDLRDMCFKDDMFDAICSLSTLEHIGLDNTRIYTPDPTKNENEKYSFLGAIREFKRVLRPGGTLYLTMPFGTYKNHGWFQVFDTEMVSSLVKIFAPAYMDKTFFRYEHDQWIIACEEHCTDGTCFDIRAGDSYHKDYLAFSRCVVCLELKK